MESIERICERFADGTDQACDDNNQEEHLHRFFRDIALDFASTVFINLEFISFGEIDQRSTRAFIERGRLTLVRCVIESMSYCGASASQIKAAEAAAVSAYAEQLDRLSSSISAGGSA